MSQIIGDMLGEKAQIAAAKELCSTVAKHMTVIGVHLDYIINIICADAEE